MRSTFTAKCLAALLSFTFVLGTVSLDLRADDRIHTVKRDESWWSIGRKYGVSYRELAEYNGQSPNDIIFTGQKLRIPGDEAPTPTAKPTSKKPAKSADASKDIIHRVVWGESWWAIGEQYGIPYPEIAQYNKRKPSSILYVGEHLRIPGDAATSQDAAGSDAKEAPASQAAADTSTGEEIIHVVKRGDTWWGLGQKYGVPYARIAERNGKKSSDDLYTGQKIRIPQDSKPTTPAAPSAADVADTAEQDAAPAEGEDRAAQVDEALTPDHLVHEVARNENWWALGRKYSVDYREIAALNGLKTTDHLYVGQMLKIPAQASPGSTPAQPELPLEAPPAAETSQAVGAPELTVTLQENPHFGSMETTVLNGEINWKQVLTTPYLWNMDMSGYKGLSKDQAPLKGIVVILDPGHGGVDPGGVVTVNGQLIRETSLITPTAKKLVKELEALGATVVTTRLEDTYRSMYGRVYAQGMVALDIWEQELKKQSLDTAWIDALRGSMAGMDVARYEDSFTNQGIAKGRGFSPELRLLMDAEYQLKHVVFISLHANINQYASASGTRIYLSPKPTNDRLDRRRTVTPAHPFYTFHNDEADRRLADSLLASSRDIVPELAHASSGLNPNTSYNLLRLSGYPSLLYEIGFMTNAQDLVLMQDPAVQTRVAQAIADGVYRYYCK